MLRFLTSFRDCEDGAVTVDWVVLTAALVGLAVAVIATIGASATDKSSSVGAFLSAQEVVDYNK